MHHRNNILYNNHRYNFKIQLEFFKNILIENNFVYISSRNIHMPLSNGALDVDTTQPLDDLSHLVSKEQKLYRDQESLPMPSTRKLFWLLERVLISM